jgi:hypothetical protein
VIHLRIRIHPHQPRSAARGHRRRVRGIYSGRDRLRRCLGSWSWNWCCCRSHRSGLCCGSRSSSCRWSRRLSASSVGSSIPILHSLVPAARALLARARPIRPVLAHSSRARRRACRSLCHQPVCNQQPSRNHHHSNHRLHTSSDPEKNFGPTPRTLCGAHILLLQISSDTCQLQ